MTLVKSWKECGQVYRDFQPTAVVGMGGFTSAVPLLLGRHVRDWLRWRVVLPFAVVALPWYVLCYLRNGWTFVHEFFIVHHVSRVTSDALMHPRPWWFYLPIAVAAPFIALPIWSAIRGRRALVHQRDPAAQLS